MELKELKKKANEEYYAQREMLKSARSILVGKPVEWLNVIGSTLFVLAILPPFFVLLQLLNKPITYLLPDGGNITSNSAISLIVNGQLLQQVTEYASRSEITHSLEIAAVASVSLVVVAFILFIASEVVTYHSRRQFIEQYIFEHREPPPQK